MQAPPRLSPVVALDRSSATPLHRQIYLGYREAILDRVLGAGERLPSTRDLAAELGVSRITVLNAFEQLLAEGYCEGRIGSGTFVASSLPEESARSTARFEASSARAPARRRALSRASSRLLQPPVPWIRNVGAFRIGDIAIERFPLRAWSTLAARSARRLRPEELRYGDAMGYPPLRAEIAAYLGASRGVRCETEQVLVVSGSQQGLDLAVRVILDAGSQVWVEEPGYWGAQDVLATAGARLVPVPVDGEGLDVAAGIRQAPRARAAVVTPSHQFPLGATMSARRRIELLDWARRSAAWVIEDDYDSEYRYESAPITALQGLDRDARVVYVGTFSKVLFPSIRLGYLVLPADLVERFLVMRRVLDISPPVAAQAVLAEFMRAGHFARHLRRMRRIYAERRRALVEAIRSELADRVEILGEQAGLHLLAALPKGRRDRPLAERAAAEGLWLMPLSGCYLGRSARQGFVLGYGGVDVEEIPDAVRRLGALLDAG